MLLAVPLPAKPLRGQGARFKLALPRDRDRSTPEIPAYSLKVGSSISVNKLGKSSINLGL